MVDESSSGSNAEESRSAATEVARRLIEAGHEAYFAGGCVRDALMGLSPTDYDIATSARPEQIQQLFRSAHGVGESFGVMLVRHRGHSIEVATFRTDGIYSDGRHPDRVQFSDAVHDASRRDFTINGLFQHPLTSAVIDHVGGQADLKRGMIRAIGDAEARLREDRLRMLRAVRFAARFGFEIEPVTADAIRQGANRLEGVSRERIGQEVKRMLTHPMRAVAAWTLQYLGLDAVVLNEAHAAVAPTRLSRLPDEVPYPTALAAWLLDRHEGASLDLAGLVRRWAAALVLSNAETEQVAACIDAYLVLRTNWPSLGIAKQKRLAASHAFEQAELVLLAIDRATFVNIRHQVQELARSGLAPKPLLDGDDLVRLGVPSGPAYRRILDAVYDAQLEGGVKDRPQALSLARTLAGA